MKEIHDNLDQMFQNLQGQWDIAEPEMNHFGRFENRLGNAVKKKMSWIPYAAAAVLLLSVSLFFVRIQKQETPANYLSAESRKTDSIFNVNIQFGKELLKDKASAEDKKLVEDAMKQLQSMESDYDRLKQELQKNGESKQLMQALLLNLRTQLEFLESVNRQLEKNDNHQSNQHAQIM